jgi:hypothetical protein
LGLVRVPDDFPAPNSFLSFLSLSKESKKETPCEGTGKFPDGFYNV